VEKTFLLLKGFMQHQSTFLSCVPRINCLSKTRRNTGRLAKKTNSSRIVLHRPRAAILHTAIYIEHIHVPEKNPETNLRAMTSLPPDR
jgi:hypothetical protein